MWYFSTTGLYTATWNKQHFVHDCRKRSISALRFMSYHLSLPKKSLLFFSDKINLSCLTAANLTVTVFISSNKQTKTERKLCERTRTKIRHWDTHTSWGGEGASINNVNSRQSCLRVPSHYSQLLTVTFLTTHKRTGLKDNNSHIFQQQAF